MKQHLTPVNVKNVIQAQKKMTRDELAKHFDDDVKMLDFILLFWQKQGMIKVFQDDCGPCQGCHAGKKIVIESC